MIEAVSVVVPTSRRTAPLGACLAGLSSQTRPPEEVLVVVHVTDDETACSVVALAREWSALRLIRSARAGLVAALNCGLAAASGDIVAFLDDDCVPAEDWLARVIATYGNDRRIAAVGGRDAIFMDGRPFEAPRKGRVSRLILPSGVGRVQWFGRVLGNHHLGTGAPRDVDVLKGVNMSYRRQTVAGHGFDERLRGVGSQVHSELSICLPLRRRGCRIIYDPNIVVRHYPAPRPHGDHRHDLSVDTIATITHNQTLQVLDYLGPLRRVLFGLWGVAVGMRSSPGLAIVAADVLARRPDAWSRFAAAQSGRLAAWRTHRAVPRQPPDVLTLASAEEVKCASRQDGLNAPTTGPIGAPSMEPSAQPRQSVRSPGQALTYTECSRSGHKLGAPD